MIDDLGYADLSSYGQTNYQTPVIDQLISEGIRYTNAYAAAPYCTPTRVAFLTGRYPARNEIGLREPLTLNAGDLSRGLSGETPTIAALLRKSGYETALFGKWHLGQDTAYLPARHGFDHFFGSMAGGADYVDHKPFDRYRDLLYKKDIPNLYENERPVSQSGNLTDLITKHTVNFINQPHQKPFFISLQYTTPHWPWQAPGDTLVTDTVSYSRSGSFDIYAQMVQHLDKNIQTVLMALQAAGLEESTLVIFTSDNGGDRLANMHPFRGYKGSLWEGGIRVPASIRWPGKVNPGTESHQPVITMDWTKTILAAAGAAIPDSLQMDGINLLPTLATPEQEISRTFYWRTANRNDANALRLGQFKYLRIGSEEYLFNLEDDPGEKTNLKDSLPEQFKALKADFISLDKQMLPPLIL